MKYNPKSTYRIQTHSGPTYGMVVKSYNRESDEGAFSKYRVNSLPPPLDKCVDFLKLAGVPTKQLVEGHRCTHYGNYVFWIYPLDNPY